jgi:hypothetical protein
VEAPLPLPFLDEAHRERTLYFVDDLYGDIFFVPRSPLLIDHLLSPSPIPPPPPPIVPTIVPSSHVSKSQTSVSTFIIFIFSLSVILTQRVFDSADVQELHISEGATICAFSLSLILTCNISQR